jgi:hypothetical protein
VLLAALWIVGSWFLSFGASAPLHPTIAGFTPGVRLLVACLGAGLCAGWPLLRLSGPRERWPVRRVALDLVTILTLLQVVLWPLRLTTAWAPARLALIDALLAAWAILAGAFVAATIGRGDALSRTLAMVGCLTLASIGISLELGSVWTGSSPPPAWMLGPIMGPYRLGATDALGEVRSAWIGLGILLSLGALAWGLVWVRIRPAAPVAPAPTDR